MSETQTPAERYADAAKRDRLAWLASRSQDQLDRMADALEGPERTDEMLADGSCVGCGAFTGGRMPCSPDCPVDGEIDLTDDAPAVVRSYDAATLTVEVRLNLARALGEGVAR